MLRFGGPDPITSALFRYLKLKDDLKKLFDIEKMVKYQENHNEDKDKCPICLEFAINSFSNCSHWACGYCWEKMYDYEKNELKCPTCREEVLMIL